MKIKINPSIDLAEFAAIISEGLKKDGINTILTGGAVVSIYTNNRYESGDADFICPADRETIVEALSRLGFEPVTKNNKNFKHPDCEFTVEFPARQLMIGGEHQKEVSEIDISGARLRILSPTQSVMDRLAAYLAWNDIQGLDQAAWICECQQVNLSRVYTWAKREGASDAQIEAIKKRCDLAVGKKL